MFCVATVDTNLIFDIYLIFLPEHKPLKRLYQFHDRNQVNILILFCVPIMCFFKTTVGLPEGVENNHLIKLNQ